MYRGGRVRVYDMVGRVVDDYSVGAAMTWPDYEAANREFDAVLDTMFGADRKFAIDITSFIWTALGDEPLYRDQHDLTIDGEHTHVLFDNINHLHLTDGLAGPCVTCGARQLWVRQVWPEGDSDE